jgi:hypothetical protein
MPSEVLSVALNYLMEEAMTEGALRGRRTLAVSGLMLVLCFCPITASTQTSAQTSGTPTNHAGSMAQETNIPGLILEYDRAIFILKSGAEQRWTDRDKYLAAFDRLSDKGTAGESLSREKASVRNLLDAKLPKMKNGVWDEQLPCYIAAQQQIQLFMLSRDLLLGRESSPGPIESGRK